MINESNTVSLQLTKGEHDELAKAAKQLRLQPSELAWAGLNSIMDALTEIHGSDYRMSLIDLCVSRFDDNVRAEWDPVNPT